MSNFKLFKRKLHHDFMVPLNNENFENALGVNIRGNNTFLVAREGEVLVFDDWQPLPAQTAVAGWPTAGLFR